MGAALAQTLDGRVDIVGKQADMLEALFPIWVGGGPLGKTSIKRSPETWR